MTAPVKTARVSANRTTRREQPGPAAETFLIACDRREHYDLSHADARPWLYGIVSNLISRHRRTETRQYRALTRTVPQGIAESHADQVVTRLEALRAVRPRVPAPSADARATAYAALMERAASTASTPERRWPGPRRRCTRRRTARGPARSPRPIRASGPE